MEKIICKNRYDQKLIVDLQRQVGDSRGLCIIQHGYASHKNEKYLQATARVFFDARFTVLNFDATNALGDSDGSLSDFTLTRHCEDLEDIISWTKDQDWFGGELMLVGHSMGGYSVLSYAENNPSDISRIIALSPFVSGKLSWQAYQENKPELFNQWKKDRYRILKIADKLIALPWSHMEERLEHDLFVNMDSLTIPIFLYTGEKDRVCPTEHMNQFFDALPSDSKQKIIAGNVGHVYRTEEQIAHLVSSIQSWIS